MTTTHPTIVQSDEKLQRSYWLMGGLWTILAEAEGTGGRYSLIEERLPRNMGAAPHINEGQDETFAVLEGEVTFWIGDQIATVRGGSFLFIPRDVKHGFRVDSPQAHMLNQHAPGGFSQLVTTLGRPARALTMPPADWKDPEISPERREDLFAAIRQTNLDIPNPLKVPATN